MSVFSGLLEEILTEKDIKISQLAKMTGISRATLHHYVHGQRPIQKKEHFDAIANSLTLSPSQMESMREAFQIELIGETLYKQRRQIFQFFRSLGTIQEKSMTDDFHLEVPTNDGNEVHRSEVTLIAYSQSLREAFRRQKWIYLMRTDYLKSFF